MHQAHTLFQTMSLNFTVQLELHGSESVRLCQSSQQELFSCTAFASWWVEEETVAGSFLVQELPLQYVSHHVKHKVVYTHISALLSTASLLQDILMYCALYQSVQLYENLSPTCIAIGFNGS